MICSKRQKCIFICKFWLIVSSFCCSTPHLSSTMITLFMCSNATNLASDYATIVYGTGSFRTVKDHELFCSCFCSLPEQIVELPCVRAAVDCQCPVARNRVWYLRLLRGRPLRWATPLAQHTVVYHSLKPGFPKVLQNKIWNSFTRPKL